jgi:hypothetical protein
MGGLIGNLGWLGLILRLMWILGHLFLDTAGLYDRTYSRGSYRENS